MSSVSAMSPKSIIERLKQSFYSKHLNHGLLFKIHSENYSELIPFLSLILCQNPAQASACGLCESCATPIGFDAQQRQHPDFYFVSPATETGYSAEQVRDWGSQFLYLSRNISPNKVLFIKDADKLSVGGGASGNALLKVLEEPRPGNYIILCTSRPLKVLSTLKSRCLSLNINARGPETKIEMSELVCEILSVLSENTALSRLYAQKSSGLLSNPAFWKDRALRIQELEGAFLGIWQKLRSDISKLSLEDAQRFTSNWKFFEEFIWAVNHYGNPPLHWLSLKQKLREGREWKALRLFG